jgi:hypothetical protein
VPEFGGDELLKQGMLRACGDGNIARFAKETMRNAFSRPWLAVTLPGTTVMARTSSSSEFSPSMRAMASSVPGSVSKMIFLGAAKEFSERKNKNKSRTSQDR